MNTLHPRIAAAAVLVAVTTASGVAYAATRTREVASCSPSPATTGTTPDPSRATCSVPGATTPDAATPDAAGPGDGAAASRWQANASSILSPSNYFSLDLRGAPVAPNSAAMVADLNSQIVNNWGGVAAFNAHQYNTSMVVAPAATPLLRITWGDCSGWGWTPDGVYNGPAYFVDVPVPATARPATGTDGELTIWSPSADRLWEFWQMRRDATTGGWTACHGGRIDNVSTAKGQYDGNWGVAASGLVMAGYTVTLSEAKAGIINHAVGIAPIGTRSGGQWWPAVRNDGWMDSPDVLPEGARLRLDPSIDVATLGLNPVARAIARAAQVYGLIVTDKSAAVSVQAESASAVTSATGTDPWPGILGAADHEVMRNFPWDRLTVIDPAFGQPGGLSAASLHNALGTVTADPAAAQGIIGP